MRAYFFNNYYVAGIRAGIQAAHAIDQLWLQYTNALIEGALDPDARRRLDLLRDFSANHKTFILLHAGDHLDLAELAAFFALPDNPYPWATFSEPGLNDAITSIVIITPERLYDDVATAVGRSLLSLQPSDEIDRIVAERRYSPWEREFLKRRVACSRAT